MFNYALGYPGMERSNISHNWVMVIQIYTIRFITFWISLNLVETCATSPGLGYEYFTIDVHQLINKVSS